MTKLWMKRSINRLLQNPRETVTVFRTTQSLQGLRIHVGLLAKLNN